MPKRQTDNSDLDEINQSFDEERNTNFVPRFYMKAGTERRICFLSNGPQRFGKFGTVALVHYLRMPQGTSGAKFRQVTSPTTLDPKASDPLIDAGSTPKRTISFTIVDLSEWEDRNGKKHKYTKVLLSAKKEAGGMIIANIKNLRKRGDALHGAVFGVQRTSDKMSPNTGNVFTYEKHLSDAKLLELMQKYDPKATLDEMDLAELLAPPSEKELKVLAKQCFGSDASPYRDDDEEENTENRGHSRSGKPSRKIEAEEDDEDVNPFDDEE